MRNLAAGIQTEFTKLDASAIALRRDAFHRLCLEYEGKTWEGVKPVRPFPLSAPQSCVFFLDAEGGQIGYIVDVAALNRDSRVTLDEEMALLYFSTRVNVIRSVKSRHGVTTWQFETERGEKTVYVKDRNDIRTLSGRRVIFSDTNGMRFEIADTDRLDERSRALLEAET